MVIISLGMMMGSWQGLGFSGGVQERPGRGWAEGAPPVASGRRDVLQTLPQMLWLLSTEDRPMGT